MSQNSNINQKIISQLSYSTPDTTSVKLQKVKRYFQNHEIKTPWINVQNQGKQQIINLFKSTFNPEKGIILIQSHPPYKYYLEHNHFQLDISATFSQFISDVTNLNTKKEIDFMKFLSFWLEKKPNITVFYEKYHDQITNFVKSQLSSIYNKITSNFLKQNQPIKEQKNQQNNNKSHFSQSNNKEKFTLKFQIQKQDQKNIQEKISEIQQKQPYKQSSYYSTYSNKVSKNISNLQLKDPFNYYLKKFYDHYCKKYLNTIKDQQFQKLQEFYHSMNLNKFIQYCKDIKLLKFQNKLTAKYLQQIFKAQQNKKRCIEYESFAKIIRKCLQEIFETQQMIETKGYQLIGVLNRQNFVEVMGRLGVLVPFKKTVMARPELITKQQMLRKSKSKGTIHLNQSRLMKQSTLKNYSTINGHGHESNWDSNDLHPDLFLNQKQRKQQRLLQCLSIPKLNKLQPSKYMDEKLQQLVDQQYDPYLKRYNQKSVHQNSNGVLKRMDQRINNVVKKIR